MTSFHRHYTEESPLRQATQINICRSAPYPPKAYLLFSLTPLRHIAFRQFGFLNNPSQPLFFFLCQLGITQLRLLTEYHQQLFRPATLEARHFLQIPLEFVHNGISGALSLLPLWASRISSMIASMS